MRQWLSTAFTHVLDRALPPQCPLCHGDLMAQGLCADCWHQLHVIIPPFCDGCGRPLPHSYAIKKCGACLTQKSFLVRHRSVLVYNDAAKRLIVPFKHSDRLDFAPVIAGMMASAFQDMVQDDHIIMPIPLHVLRRIKRRYNQSAEITRLLCRRTGRQSQSDMTSLKRIKPTTSLARHRLTKRKQILRGAFAINKTDILALKGKRILLIDDVMTTGSTMEEAAKCLLQADVQSVEGLSFARVC